MTSRVRIKKSAQTDAVTGAPCTSSNERDEAEEARRKTDLRPRRLPATPANACLEGNISSHALQRYTVASFGMGCSLPAPFRIRSRPANAAPSRRSDAIRKSPLGTHALYPQITHVGGV